jgi:hypothetical protein
MSFMSARRGSHTIERLPSRAWAPLHTALESADNEAVRNGLGGAPTQLGLARDDLYVAILGLDVCVAPTTAPMPYRLLKLADVQA